MAVVVAAIYATLGLTPAVARALRDRNLLDATFVVGAVLVAAAVVLLGLRTRTRVAEVGVGIAVAAVYVLAFVRMALPEERTHLIEYGVVAILIFEALNERSARGRRVPAPGLFAFGATAVFGVLDELIQAALPGRVFDPADIFVNLFAAALAIVATALIRSLRRGTVQDRGTPPPSPTA